MLEAPADQSGQQLALLSNISPSVPQSERMKLQKRAQELVHPNGLGVPVELLSSDLQYSSEKWIRAHPNHVLRDYEGFILALQRDLGKDPEDFPPKATLTADPTQWVQKVTRLTTFGRWRRVAAEAGGNQVPPAKTIDEALLVLLKHFFEPLIFYEGERPPRVEASRLPTGRGGSGGGCSLPVALKVASSAAADD